MMFLQYALWGAWLPVTARYLSASQSEGGLGFSGSEIGMILGLAGSVGAIFAPFIAGQIADRYFSTEKILAFLVFSGGIVKWVTASQTEYQSWLLLSILYSILYMPTLALSNSISFAHIESQENDFPKIRVWGTIGWIVSSWIFPMLWLQTSLKFQILPPFFVGVEYANVTSRLADALRFSGIISICYGAFCFLLPNTPPSKNPLNKSAYIKAFGLFKNSSFLVLVLTSLMVSIIHQIYFLQTGPFLSSLGVSDSFIGPVMSIGQFAEILTMAYLGLFIKKLGFKRVISLGIGAYFFRYLIFGTSSLPLWLIISSQAFHGFCYAFFFAAAFIYVDKISETDFRHSAQTVFGIIILGGGPVLGGWLSGFLQEAFSNNNNLNFSSFWYSISLMGLIATLFFITLFKEQLNSKGS